MRGRFEFVRACLLGMSQKTAIGDATLAKILVFSAPSATTSKFQLKVCIKCTTTFETNIIVPAFTKNAFPLENIEMAAFFTLGIL